jgi:ABC-type lipoprotein export system ATPase subunit
LFSGRYPVCLVVPGMIRDVGVSGMQKVILEARAITRAPWLHAVSLRVAEGSLVAILDRPGAGAEHLLRILALLEEPQSGQLYLEGRLMTGLPPQEREEARRRLVAFDPALRPRILLAHHPAHLDDLLRHHAQGQTLLYTTHDPMAAAAAQAVYRLRHGTLYNLLEGR